MSNNNNKWEELSKHLLNLIQVQQHIGITVEAEKNKEIIKGKILNKIRADENSKKSFYKIPKKIICINSYHVLVATFTLLVMLIGCFYLFDPYYLDKDKISQVCVKAPNGASSSLYLPDGTQVILNSNSTLIYPSIFTEKNKKIKLKGEAFFEVTPKKNNPLIIETDKLNTHVLGTKLNIKAYPEENEVQLTLLEGKVVAEIKENNSKNEKIELKPNQQLALNINDYNFIKRTVVGHDYSAWTQGKLVFRNAPLNEIIMTLNRRFNVKIESQPSTLSLNSKYIATFDQTQSLDEILNILSYQQKWRYVKDKGVYRITLK